jgi:thioredoxin-like negative regulator of GroEL
MPSKPKTATPATNFNATTSPAQERPRLVFFHSRRDGPCRRAEGYIAQVLQRRNNHATFLLHQVEVEEHPDLAERFQVEDVPTLLVIADRRIKGRLTHPKGCRDIEAMLKPWLR